MDYAHGIFSIWLCLTVDSSFENRANDFFRDYIYGNHSINQEMATAIFQIQDSLVDNDDIDFENRSDFDSVCRDAVVSYLLAEGEFTPSDQAWLSAALASDAKPSSWECDVLFALLQKDSVIMSEKSRMWLERILPVWSHSLS